MKHVHYDKIVAKAANMDLVVFSYCNLDRLWSEDIPNQPEVGFIDSSNTNYFLCLPQHKEACLHWLNGGDVQQSPLDIEQWVTTGNKRDWMNFHSFMQEGLIFKIKPKKEKRWIAYNKETKITTTSLYNSRESVKGALIRHHEWQFIEIEVEV